METYVQKYQGCFIRRNTETLKIAINLTEKREKCVVQWRPLTNILLPLCHAGKLCFGRGTNQSCKFASWYTCIDHWNKLQHTSKETHDFNDGSGEIYWTHLTLTSMNAGVYWKKTNALKQKQCHTIRTEGPSIWYFSSSTTVFFFRREKFLFTW